MQRAHASAASAAGQLSLILTTGRTSRDVMQRVSRELREAGELINSALAASVEDR